MGSTYQSTSRPIHGLPATGRYHGFSPVPSDTRLYRAITVKISPITSRYRSITINFDHHCPLPSDISLAAVGCSEGRSKRRREKKSENIGRCHPLTARWQLGYRRCLRPKNHGTTPRIRTSRGGNFFAMVFVLSPSPRLRRRGKDGSIDDFLPARGG
ncbi:hypothetical protein GW17_00024522, partial [Ensete ventricosum]